MPMFEFTCRACGHTFETLVMGARRPRCPACGADDLQKLYSTFAAGSSSAGARSDSAVSRFT